MNTRFIIPAVTALSFHLVAFYGMRHSTASKDADPRGIDPKFSCPLVMPDLIEETPAPGAVAKGRPDVDRSADDHDLRPPRDDVTLVPNLPRTRPSAVATTLPVGPIGITGGIGSINVPGALATVDGLDNPPRTRSQVPPGYPFEAKKDGLPGEVLVEFTVDETGRVINPRVVRSNNSVFETPTLRAVAKWRFEPGRRNGRIVRFRMAQPVVFSLNE